MATSERNRFALAGTVKAVQQETTSQGKAFVRLIVETDGYEDREFGGYEAVAVPLEVFGQSAERAAACRPGAVIEARGFLTGREHQGKWYGGFRTTAFREVTPGAPVAAPPPASAAPAAAADDIPF